MNGIAEMFDEFAGGQRYEDAIERRYWWALGRAREQRSTPFLRRAAVERTRAWRRANPDRNRTLAREQMKRARARGAAWYQRYPDKAREAKARYIEANRERMREMWRRNSIAYRERKRASLDRAA